MIPAIVRLKYQREEWMSKLNVKKLKPELKFLLGNFDSGNLYLDHFIKGESAWDRSIGKTYLLLSDDGNQLIGYYNISVGSLDLIENGIHEKLGGCVHINCFALDKRYQKCAIETEGEKKLYLSDLLLADCMRRVSKLREKHIGVAFITLNSTKEGLWLYTRNDFEPLEEDMFFSIDSSDIECTQMYLPLDIENFTYI